MKSTLFKVILVSTVFSMASCTEVNKRVDEKIRVLDKKAGQLDSMLTHELEKVQQLDTIIKYEIVKTKQLDSIIQRSRLAVDSILNKK